MQKKKIVVIGAGFGGLSSAALLARHGHEVTVLEMHDQPGGRARVWKSDGFSFDMGPSWYMNPDIFEKFFAIFGKKPTDYYDLERLDPAYRMFFGKGDFHDISPDFEKNVALFESIEPGAGAQLRKYIDVAEYQYRVSKDEVLYKHFRTLRDFFSWRLFLEARSLHLFENLAKYTSRFFKTKKLRQMLEYAMVFLGGAPNNTPAIYALINYVDMKLGIWYPVGGYGSVARGFERLGKEQGAIFRYNAEVTAIETSGDRATGVRLKSGEVVEADLVVANGDYHHLDTVLLPEDKRSYTKKWWESRTVAPSAFLLYVGIKGKMETLAHHNLFVENDWRPHFDAIFDNPGWPEKPSYYVCVPSKSDETVAPADGENLFILMPVASGIEDSDAIREKYSDYLLSHLEGITGEPIRDRIVVKRVYSQQDFVKDYHAFKGTGLGLAHTLMQTAVFRPKAKSEKLTNLYYAGQYTHPGIGVPMTVISATVVDEVIAKDVS